MVSRTARQELHFQDTGTIDWNPIIANFTNIFQDMDDNAREITALAQRQTWTVTKMFEGTGSHVIMAGGKHLRCKVINVFCQLGDNIEEEVAIIFHKDRLVFSKTENAGKTRAIRLEATQQYHFKDDITVQQEGKRRVVYTFTFESIEEDKK